MTETLSEQVNRIISENQHLRVKTDNDAKTLHLMRDQYDLLAASVEGMRAKHETEIHTMRTQRDQAVRRFKEIDTLLLQASNIIMQALRARQGDETPDKMQERELPHLQDDRLPIARLS